MHIDAPAQACGAGFAGKFLPPNIIFLLTSIDATGKLTPSEQSVEAAVSARSNMPVCKHPQVRIIAREDETEYVECILCSEVFDSEEYKDLAQENEQRPEAEAKLPEA